MKTVTIMRKWNDPRITIDVTSEDIQIKMGLDDFISALADEVAEPLVNTIASEAGSPALWFTKDALVKNLVKTVEGDVVHQHFITATDKIIELVKKETNKIL